MPTQSLHGCIHGGFPSRYPPCPKLDDAALLPTLTGQDKGYRLRGAQVTVCEAFDDTVTVLYKGQTLSHRVLSEGEPPIPLDDEKSLQQTVDNAKTRQQAAPKRKPDPDHP